MEQASVVLFWFALALYIAATVLYAYQFVLKRSSVGWWARFFTGAGFICQTLSIGAHSIATGGTQLNGANQLMLASWALVLLYFIMEHLIKIKIYGTFLIPVAVVFMAAAEVDRRADRPDRTHGSPAGAAGELEGGVPRRPHRVRQCGIRVRGRLGSASICGRRGSSRSTARAS